MVTAFAKLVEFCRWGHVVEVQTYIDRFDGHPHTSPYFVLVPEPDHTLTVEFSGNLQVIPKLTATDFDRMAELGWAEPRAAKDEDYGDFPNFSRTFPLMAEHDDIARFVLQALVDVYSFEVTSQIGLEREREVELLENQKALEHLGPDGQEDVRHIFQIKSTREFF